MAVYGQTTQLTGHTSHIGHEGHIDQDRIGTSAPPLTPSFTRTTSRFRPEILFLTSWRAADSTPEASISFAKVSGFR